MNNCEPCMRKVNREIWRVRLPYDELIIELLLLK